MKRFILLFISFALFSFHSAFAQGFVVKGTVTAHEDGSPLIGVPTWTVITASRLKARQMRSWYSLISVCSRRAIRSMLPPEF